MIVAHLLLDFLGAYPILVRSWLRHDFHEPRHKGIGHRRGLGLVSGLRPDQNPWSRAALDR